MKYYWEGSGNERGEFDADTHLEALLKVQNEIPDAKTVYYEDGRDYCSIWSGFDGESLEEAIEDLG